MALYEIPAPTTDLSYVPLAEYDPAAIAFMDAAFAEFDAQVEAVGSRAANWDRHEVTTAAGLFIARTLDRDTIMMDLYYPESGSGAHSEQFEISDRVAFGNLLYSGGTNPEGRDYEDTGHNDDPVFAFEALMQDGTEAPVSVRIGLRRAAINGLMVVSAPKLWDLPTELRFFNPTHYKHATADPIRRDFPAR